MSGCRWLKAARNRPQRNWWRRSWFRRRLESGLEQQLLEVEVALHAPHHGIADRSPVTQADQLPPFHGQELLHEPPIGGGDGLLTAVRYAIRLAAVPPRAVMVAVAHVGQRLRVHPLRRRQLLEAHERRLRSLEPGRGFLASLLLTRLAHAQPAEQRPERKALAQQRHDDHGESDRDDQVAPGERRTSGGHGGNGGSQDQGVRAAQAPPRNDRREPPWRGAVPPPPAPAPPTRGGGRPGQPPAPRGAERHADHPPPPRHAPP